MDQLAFVPSAVFQDFSKLPEIFHFMFQDPNLRVIALTVPLLVFAYLLYVRRESIFEKKYDDASDFGLHGNNTMEDPQRAANGKILTKKNKYSPTSFKDTLDSIEEGIIIGRIPDKNELLIIHDGTEIDNKNILVYGASGAGKGQSYVLPNILNIRNQSIIVVDPKGENYALTHQIKRDQGYKVYTIDFVEFAQARYNPLDLILNDEEAQKVSKSIVGNSTKDGKEDFFSERAQKLLAGLMVYVKATYPKKEANMNKVIDVYNKHISDPDECETFLKVIPLDHPARKLLISVLPALVGNTRGSVIASFDSGISIFQLSRISEMTKKSDFSFDEFQDGKSILYVKISTPTNPYQPLTSVFFNQMIDRLYLLAGQNETKKLNVPINFILDEFPNIGRFEGYEEILATCRGLLIYMHTIIQDISQLENQKLYGKEGTRGLIANHDTQLILKVNEKETAKMFSERFGKTTVKHKAESVTVSDGKRSVSRNDTFIERDLITAGQILTMPRDKAYLLISGHNVMEIEKAWQYEVFGHLITKNRTYNYEQTRKVLGYMDPIFTEDISRNTRILSFDEYQRKHYGQFEGENTNDENSWLEKDEETPKKLVHEAEAEGEVASSFEELTPTEIMDILESVANDEKIRRDFKETDEGVKLEDNKEQMNTDERLDALDFDFESIALLLDTSQSVDLLKQEMLLVNSQK